MPLLDVALRNIARIEGATPKVITDELGADALLVRASGITGAFLSKGGDVHSVKAYGALGDDVADDTAAIEAAITAAGTDGVVYFPKGTYRTAPLGMLAGQRWYGASKRGSVLRCTTPSAPTFVEASSNGVLASLGFASSNVTQPTAPLNGVGMTGASDVLVYDCWFTNNFWWGVFVTGHSVRVSIVDSHFDGVLNSHAIEINDSSYCSVVRCRILSSPNNGVEIYPKSDSEGIGNIVAYCKIEGCAAAGVGQYGGHGTLIQGNVIRNCTRHGVYIDCVEFLLQQGQTVLSTRGRCVGNEIIDCGSANSHGINILRSKLWLIEGNAVSGANNNGIAIGASLISVVNNTSTLNGRSGIGFYNGGTGSNNNTVSGNLCVNNSTLGPSTASAMYIAGDGHLISGNTCTDDRTPKLQDLGIVLACTNSKVIGNNFRGNVNPTGIYNPGGASNELIGNLVG